MDNILVQNGQFSQNVIPSIVRKTNDTLEILNEQRLFKNIDKLIQRIMASSNTVLYFTRTLTNPTRPKVILI